MKEFLRLPWGGREVGGVLFGTREPDCLRIAAHRPLSCEHRKGPAFELSENDKAGLRKLVEDAQQDDDLTGLQPVGWYLSKYRSFDLTRNDLEIYNSFFPKPWQVSMVFQRGKKEPCVLGFFFRREDDSIHSAHRKFTIIEEPLVQPRERDATTRSLESEKSRPPKATREPPTAWSLLADAIVPGPGVVDQPTAPSASPLLATAPEPEKSPPAEARRTTRPSLSEAIVAGSGVANQPTPPAVSQPRPTAPEPEISSPARGEPVTTRPLLSDAILASSDLTDQPTPPLSPSLLSAPESEKSLPPETRREPATQAVVAETPNELVHTDNNKDAVPEGGTASSSPVSARQPGALPLNERPEYRRVLQYLEDLPDAQPQLPDPPETASPQLSHLDFFGLRKNPFSQGSIPAFPYWSPQHKEILAGLRYGVQTRKGLMVVTGESGTGKTTLLKRLGEFLTEQSVTFAFLLNSKLTAEEFYEMVDYDLELGCAPPSKPNVLHAVSRLLDARGMQDKTTVLIVDEAQNLQGEVLEGIQQWDSLQDQRGKLLQTVLCGFPELERKLALKQRVGLRCHLRPFRQEETMQYIAGQLARAGMPQQTIFEQPVMVEIHLRSRGLLRVVNTICDKLLEKCGDARGMTVTIGMLDKVSTELQL